MDLTQKIKAAQAARDSALSLISPEDAQEIEQRKQLAEIEAEREFSEKQRRDLDLVRRLESAQSLEPTKRFRAVSVVGFADTFVVRYNGPAFSRWRIAVSRSARDKNSDTTSLNVEFAKSVIFDWNGLRDFDTNPNSTIKLDRLFSENPGLLTPVTDAALELSGAIAEERKS